MPKRNPPLVGGRELICRDCGCFRWRVYWRKRTSERGRPDLSPEVMTVCIDCGKQISMDIVEAHTQ